MALTPRLDLRQSQSLVMTPQLQQAIKLLALSNIELETHIAEEVERNPLLELVRAGEGPEESAPNGPTEARNNAEALTADAGSDAMMRDGAVMTDSPLDVEGGPEDGADRGAREEGTDAAASAIGAGDSFLSVGYSENGPDFDSFASADISLQEHLMEQARLRLSDMDLLIASQLIGQMDDSGYLEVELFNIADALGLPLARIEAVLAVIHGFDPVGVGARSLSECLALQAKEADRYDPAMATLIANLDLLAKRALPQLRRICGVDEEDLFDMIRELRGYDPKPGLRFSSNDSHGVIADVFVTPRGQGWAIEINAATLPQILINRHYHAELLDGAQDKASKTWLTECMTSANWLVRALDQRQRTIIRVVAEIVRQQEEFFRRGVSGLRPMTLKAVADAIDMHESTVSRVTSNKYLSCPRGLYELKYFFTSAIASVDGGEGASAEAVKSRIQALISGEDARKILSDDTLVDLLKAEGFDIARRTVAKYRESLGIGSSVQRRRQKALAG
ncbi:MAG: RNA polymerase factor sigma-54 [Sphingobium sp.]|nr:RNA polymerase factor sigma-54 [Sphingobium sp.]